MNFNKKYLPKSDVVFTVMFLNKELCERTLQAILGENIELVDIVAESKNDMHKAALNAIYFDIKTKAVDGRIVTLDLQRKYRKDRVRKRTVYYACREISSQKVSKGEYENLKSVVVTFLLTEATLKHTNDNKHILLKDETGNIYSDILTIHEVNMKHINQKNSQEMQILKAFFEINTQKDFQNFSENYSQNDYGRLLLDAYAQAIRDDTLLDSLAKEDKYMIRLSDEERLEEREKGEKIGKEIGKEEKAVEITLNMLKMDLDMDFISQATGLSEKEIQQLKSSI